MIFRLSKPKPKPHARRRTFRNEHRGRSHGDGAAFHLVHLSDLHFGRLVGHENPLSSPDFSIIHWLKEKFPFGLGGVGYPTTYVPQAVINFLTTLFPYPGSASVSSAFDGAIDAFVITGDVATTGEPDDLEDAKKFLESGVVKGIQAHGIHQEFRSILDAAPIVMLPGNHDRYKFKPVWGPWSQGFEATFGDGWDQIGGRNQDISISFGRRVKAFSFQKKNEVLTVVAIDCSLMSVLSGGVKWGWYGRGRVDGALIAEVEKATRQMRLEAEKLKMGCTVVWALHYEPKANDGSLSLVNERALLGLSKKLDVSLWMTGHTHTPLLKKIDYRSHRVTVINSGSAFSACQMRTSGFSFGYLSIRVFKGRVSSTSVKSYRYDSRGAFYPRKMREVVVPFGG